MKKTIRWIGAIALIITIELLISCVATAESKEISVTVLSTQSEKKLSLNLSDKANTFRFGKSSIGSFQIAGNINKETTYMGFPAVGLESGNLSFEYRYNGSYLKESDTSWSLTDDGSREIDSIKLDASIKKGALLVQKSYDGKAWINAAPPVINYFATVRTGNNQFYTTDGSDIARGTFYRVLVAYKMRRKDGNYGLFNALPSYEEIYCVETYSFYACTNTGIISLHNMCVEESTVALNRSGYETGGDYKYESKSPVSRMSYGSSGICDIKITGQFSGGATAAKYQTLNLVRGNAILTLSYNGQFLTDTPKSWKLISSGTKKVSSIKLPQKMETGAVIVQFSADGVEYSNLSEPLCNFFAAHPKGMELPVVISKNGYYKRRLFVHQLIAVLFHECIAEYAIKRV